jgi:hypothetical protein
MITIALKKTEGRFSIFKFPDFTVPLFDPIAPNLLLANVNDYNPSPDVGNN